MTLLGGCCSDLCSARLEQPSQTKMICDDEPGEKSVESKGELNRQQCVPKCQNVEKPSTLQKSAVLSKVKASACTQSVWKYMKVDADRTCALARVCGRVFHLLEPWGNLWGLSDTTCRPQPW